MQADTTDRHEAEVERLRLQAQERTRAEREALLGRIGQTIRTADSPHQVLELAVEGLGQALGADRCYYVVYD